MDSLTLPRAEDLHVHLRQGRLLRLVTPLLRAGGTGRCVVMPNTDPPVSTAERAIAYREELRAVETDVEYLMTLYLTPELTPREVEAAAAAGVAGVKCYPRGVTTGSASGVEDLSVHAEAFRAMEAHGLVLQIHGESPSDPDADICVLNAEARFLPELTRLHERFPDLRIVLEHVTTAEAVERVEALGETVGATITAHHLELVADDWAGRSHHFCKPVAKYPHDREALRRVVREGHPRFFLGSDSAPHPRDRKETAEACAGVFTSPLLLPYLADTFDRLGMLDRLEEFATGHGRRFYDLAPQEERVTLRRRETPVPGAYGDVVPFRAGATLRFAVEAS